MTRFVHAMFCDDIRHEVNGKVSFIGVYTGKLMVSIIPSVLPKLCVAITISTPISRPFESLSIKGSYLDQEVFAMELKEDEIKNLAASVDIKPDAKIYFIQTFAILSPLHLPGPGRLNIEVIADRESLYCPKLDIELAPPGTISSF